MSSRPNTPVPNQREVARPVSNLGNTCYMNAVLQALAHAPELCLAMDLDAHYKTCPIYRENHRPSQASPSSSPEANSSNKPPQRKLRRSNRKSPTTTASANYSNNNASLAEDEELLVATDNNSSTTNNSNSAHEHPKFCALCEVEHHVREVHSKADGLDKDKAVAPSNFVHGFITQVAPWFKLGMQEDSHEFLRLLIDAMQKSCKVARDGDAEEEDEEEQDSEYPFQLFRGTVESNVTCDSCEASSSTMDPIEDVGLEVSMPEAPDSAGAAALSDVDSAFKRFARIEALDAGYKCEKCGKGGRATKQSRLASIPPILTLHLKRFRYGGERGGTMPGAVQTGSNRRAKSGSAKIEGHIEFKMVFDLKPYLTDELQAKHSTMLCRLFAVVVHAGKNSHSGHYVAYVRNINRNEWWKMDDARVTLATVNEVKQAEAYMLFYRVVNHPFAVQLEKRAAEEADAARTASQEDRGQTVTTGEPNKEEAVADAADSSDPGLVPMEVEDLRAPAVAKGGTATATAAAQPSSTAAPVVSQQPPPGEKRAIDTKASPAAPSPKARSTGVTTRKRSAPPEFTDGESWARAKTRLKSSSFSSLRKAQDFINENVQFKPAFFKLINDEGSKATARLGQLSPAMKMIGGEDVVGGSEKYQKGLRRLIYRLARRYEEEHGESFFASGGPLTTSAVGKSNLLDKFVAVVEPTEDNLL